MAVSRKKGAVLVREQESFVLDCSIVLSWYFADESNPYADAVANSFSITSAFVPAHWSLEVANALLMGERRNRSNSAQAQAFIDVLSSLPIKSDAQTDAQALTSTIAMARKHGLTSYDAAYLELAQRSRLAIATIDEALIKAAKSLNIERYRPASN